MTIQSCKKAIAIAWRRWILFPLPLSPTIIVLIASFLPLLGCMSWNSLLNSRVSERYSVPGLRNSGQLCVGLKASIAFKRSTIGPGIPTTFPCSSESKKLLAFRSGMSTNNAFVLLNTTRLRIAFLSPGAGVRPRLSCNGLFFFTVNVVLAPRLGRGLLLPLTGFRCTFNATAVVVKGKRSLGQILAGGKSNEEVKTVSRVLHLQQIDEAI